MSTDTTAATREWLTTEQVARLIQTSPDYVARQCAAGSLRAKRLGKTWRVARRDLDEFMAGEPAPATRPGRLSRRQRRQVWRAS